MNKEISVIDIYKTAWANFKKEPVKLILIAIVYMIIALIPSFALIAIGDDASLGFLINLVSIFIGGILYLGFVNVSFKVLNNQYFTISDLLNRTDLLLTYIITYLLFCISIFFGIILLIIPGIILSIKLSQYTYIIVDEENISGIDTLKRSWNITKGHALDLIVFFIFTSIIFCIAIIFTCGIGIFAVIPVTMIAGALFYKELVEDYNRKNSQQEYLN